MTAEEQLRKSYMKLEKVTHAGDMKKVLRICNGSALKNCPNYRIILFAVLKMSAHETKAHQAKIVCLMMMEKFPDALNALHEAPKSITEYAKICNSVRVIG